MTQMEHLEKTEKALSRFPSVAQHIIFPRGASEASDIISSVAIILELDLSTADENKYHKILSMYSTFIYFKMSEKQPPADIILSSFIKDFAEFFPRGVLAKAVITYFIIHLRSPSFVIATKNNLATIDFFIPIFFPDHEHVDVNKTAHLMNLDDPEFGLVPNKPIYTVGVNGSRLYLSALKTSNGESIKWARRGCTQVEGVHGLVDVYDICLENGTPYKTIFINMYGVDTSKKAPCGFIIGA